MLWRWQFVNVFDLIAIMAALATLAVAWSRLSNSFPRNQSAYAVSLYRFQQAASEPWRGLSQHAFDLIKSASSQDEILIRRALGMMLHTSAPGMHYDSAFSYAAASLSTILLVPVEGPFHGGEFTIPSELDQLIDKGLLRELSMPVSLEPGKPIDFFYGTEVFRITPSRAMNLRYYTATPLSRELILASKDSTWWRDTCLSRLAERIFQGATIDIGKVQIKDANGRRWAETGPLNRFEPKLPN